MAFDKNYKLLEDMTEGHFYPRKIVKKILRRLKQLIKSLERGEKNESIIQDQLDEITEFINEQEAEFYRNKSEIDTIARESIVGSIAYILSYYGVNIDGETATRKREW